MCAWSEKRVTSSLPALTVAIICHLKSVWDSVKQQLMSRGADVLPHTVCPPAGPLSLGDLWSTVRTVKRTSWFYFATPQCIPGATGALGQVVPCMDAETPGQASRKWSALLRGWCYVQCKRDYRMEMNGDSHGERRESFHFMKYVWLSCHIISIKNRYFSCYLPIWESAVANESAQSAEGFKDHMCRVLPPSECWASNRAGKRTWVFVQWSFRCTACRCLWLLFQKKTSGLLPWESLLEVPSWAYHACRSAGISLLPLFETAGWRRNSLCI